MLRSPPSSLVPSRPALGRAPAPSGSPQGRSTANRPRGQTALCAHCPGARLPAQPARHVIPCSGRLCAGVGGAPSDRQHAARAPRITIIIGVTPHHPVQRQRRQNRQSGGSPSGRRRGRRRRNAAQPGGDGAASSASRRQRRGESDTPTEVKDHGRGAGERRAASGTPTVAIDRGRGAMRGSPSESSETRRHSKPGHDPKDRCPACRRSEARIEAA